MQNSLEEENTYPFEMRDDTCRYNSGAGKVVVKAFYSLTVNNPSQLQLGVLQQPISVALDGASNVFQSYSGGIINSGDCGTTRNHAVLLIGYGNDNGQDYWLLKNSWGTGWGEQGFFRLARNMNDYSAGMCGLQGDPEFPGI